MADEGRFDLSEGRGVIQVYRERAVYRDRLARYRVVIDGVVAGKLASGETGRYAVDPGEHTVQMTTNGPVSGGMFTSPKRKVVVASNELVRFMCEAGGPAIEGPLVFFRPHRYIRLTEPVHTRWPT